MATGETQKVTFNDSSTNVSQQDAPSINLNSPLVAVRNSEAEILKKKFEISMGCSRDWPVRRCVTSSHMDVRQ